MMDRELSIFRIAQNFIKDNFKKANLKDKVILYMRMDRDIRDIFKMICKMGSDNISLQIHKSYIRGHSLMMPMRVTVSFYIRMEIDTRVLGFKIL